MDVFGSFRKPPHWSPQQAAQKVSWAKVMEVACGFTYILTNCWSFLYFKAAMMVFKSFTAKYCKLIAAFLINLRTCPYGTRLWSILSAKPCPLMNVFSNWQHLNMQRQPSFESINTTKLDGNLFIYLAGVHKTKSWSLKCRLCWDKVVHAEFWFVPFKSEKLEWSPLKCNMLTVTSLSYLLPPNIAAVFNIQWPSIRQRLGVWRADVIAWD